MEKAVGKHSGSYSFHETERRRQKGWCGEMPQPNFTLVHERKRKRCRGSKNLKPDLTLDQEKEKVKKRKKIKSGKAVGEIHWP